MAVDADKFEKRLATLSANAHKAARDVSRAFEHYERISGAITFVGGDAFRAVNVRYWEQVGLFKKENDFPAGSFINNPKIAALTAYVALTHPEPLFKQQSGIQVDVHESFFDFCFVRYTLHAMLGFMDLELKDLGDKKALYNFIRTIRRDPQAINSRSTLYGLCMYMCELWPAESQLRPGVQD